MNVKLLTEHHLECLSLKEGCTGLSESTFVKMPHCSKSHVAAQMDLVFSGSFGRLSPSLMDTITDGLIVLTYLWEIFITVKPRKFELN